MKTCSIVLLALLMVAPAMAGSINFLFGDDFVGIDVSQRFGPISLGVEGAVDYWSDSMDGKLAVVTNNNYVGPTIKLHALPEDSDIDLFAAYTPLIQNGRYDKDIFHVKEAGAMWNITKSIGIGVSYIHCDEMPNSNGMMFRLKPFQW